MTKKYVQRKEKNGKGLELDHGPAQDLLLDNDILYSFSVSFMTSSFNHVRVTNRKQLTPSAN